MISPVYQDLSESPDPSTSPYPRVSPEAGKKRRKMAEDDSCKATISVNGGPQIPFDDAHEAQIMEELAPVVARGMGVSAKKARAGGIAADQLRTIVERIERMESEKAEIASDIKDIYAEAKGNGLDVPTLKKILKLRAMDAAERDEAQHLLDTYCAALGMQTSFNFSEEE